MDCDMLGFASVWSVFKQNNIDIDKEFASMPNFDESKYAEGRLNFLMSIYKKGIFRSPYMRRLHEDKALRNLRWYLTELGAQGLQAE